MFCVENTMILSYLSMHSLISAKRPCFFAKEGFLETFERVTFWDLFDLTIFTKTRSESRLVFWDSLFFHLLIAQSHFHHTAGSELES